MGYEVLSAFFLEAGFLGVMLFGRDRVGPKLHFFATAMVAAGTFMSAFWILAVNSWMQTPAGFTTNDKGQFIVVDWLAVIFNPSLPYRLVHMVFAAYLTTALIIGGVGALHLLRDPETAPLASCFPWRWDGDDRRAPPNPGRRRARRQHARAPAGQDRGDGRRF